MTKYNSTQLKEKIRGNTFLQGNVPTEITWHDKNLASKIADEGRKQLRLLMAKYKDLIKDYEITTGECPRS